MADKTVCQQANEKKMGRTLPRNVRRETSDNIVIYPCKFDK